MVAKTLVSTADERTWPKGENKSVLFLGEWCKRYSRKVKWNKFNSEVAPYHWDDRKLLFQDYQYLLKLHEDLLKELSAKLNQIHSVEYSLGYWRILIGPWLGYFVQMLFDRWSMLNQSIENLECTNCRVIERDQLSVVPNDMNHFVNMYDGDDWNEAIYGQLLDSLWSKSIRIDKIKTQQEIKNNQPFIKQGWETLLKSKLKKWIFRLSTVFPNEARYFFISSYLPLKIDLLLQLRLGQFPRIWRSNRLPVTRPDISKRNWKLSNNEGNLSSFDAVARKFIPMHIPTAYLEGYDQLIKSVDILPWPKKPKVIFTSNAYNDDDLFKAWAAEKVEKNTPLIIGQHGGHFGMTPFSFTEDHQIKIATKWLSWGWLDDSRSQVLPMGNLKCMGSRQVKYNPKGGALMVSMTIPRYSYHLYAIPASRQWLDFMADQQMFLLSLSETLRKKITLRLYSKDYGWDQSDRWSEQMPEVCLDLGLQNFYKLIEQNRIFIATYNATTYLESLNWNIPTIIFWNPMHSELKEEVIPYFELLESVGIFHRTPESAAQHMLEVWDNVSDWWESREVQSARAQFCHQYSRVLPNPIGDLQSFFQSVASEYDLSV
jgi:putative transferase (TIGR04331 family)